MPRFVVKLLAALLIIVYVVSIGGTWGKPLADRWGTFAVDIMPESDFLVFYAASSLSLSGRPEAVYDARLKAEEKKILTGGFNRSFLYPPTYLLLVLPLALLSFFTSLAVWNAMTLAGFVTLIRRAFPHELTIWAVLAFPATFQNVIRGQNGCLSVIFVGGGLLLLERYPFAGGVLLGLMSYKPNLFFLIPVALLAGHRWRALAGTLATAGGLALLSLAVFGPETWFAYGRQLLFITDIMQPGVLKEFNITFFGAATFLTNTPVLARLLQWLVMGVMVSLVAWSWSRTGSLAVKGSILVIGMMLFPPYAMIYDLTLLALPLAWLSREGYDQGWIPGEIPLLVLAWLMPASATFLAYNTGVQIAPFILTGLLAFPIVKQYAQASNN
jgi:hypothetical protein